MTGGSRVTFATGWAAYEAAQDIKRQMIARAAQIWEVQAGRGGLRGRRAAAAKSDAGQAADVQGAGRASCTQHRRHDRRPGQRRSARASAARFATHIVDVEVDPDTGKVTILRYTAVQDVGKAIHPSYVEGQIQGGAVQGIGWALNEEYVYNDKGEMTNASFLDYRMPTSLDLPMIDTVIVEVPNPGHPYGVRGVGEVPIVPPPAAIANAIYQAVGVRMNELPMSPGRVCKAMLQWRRSEDAWPLVWIPPLLRDLTGGQETVTVPGRRCGEVIEALDGSFPACETAAVRGRRAATRTRGGRGHAGRSRCGLKQPVERTARSISCRRSAAAANDDGLQGSNGKWLRLRRECNTLKLLLKTVRREEVCPCRDLRSVTCCSLSRCAASSSTGVTEPTSNP